MFRHTFVVDDTFLSDTAGGSMTLQNLLGLYRIVQARESVRWCRNVASLNIAIELVERGRL